jgi:hypothetical protein
MKKLALISCILAATACDSSKPAADKTAEAAKAKTEAPEAAVNLAVAVAAAGQAEEAHDGEANGCIYAEGEKDTPHAEEGCPHGEQADGEGTLAAKSDGHFGDPFANTTDAVPLAKAIDADSKDGILVSGEVEAVCQKKGCWMVVKDGDVSARVLMKDHGFAVPMDSRGKKVQVEGTLTSRTFNDAQVKHLEKDGGGDPDKVSGTRTEHVLTASGILIQS